MTKPFFSIIIPTYNRADLITKAIESILNQKFQDFEIIVVDDGSKDNTEEVVKNLDDKRIRYFKKENEERSIARNFGIDKANGKYINFLDADDLQYLNHLQTAHKNISYETEILHLGFEFTDTNGLSLSKEVSFDENTLKNLYFENPIHCNAIFIKNEILQKDRFIHNKNATFAEDWYLWLLLASKYKFKFVNEITSCVIEHEDRSVTNINSQKVFDSIYLIVKEVFKNKYIVENYGKKNLNLFANNRYMFCSYTALSQKRYGLFLISLFMAFKYSPTKTISRLIKKLKGNS